MSYGEDMQARRGLVLTYRAGMCVMEFVQYMVDDSVTIPDFDFLGITKYEEQERRSALISAAVTGKIDVRGLAAAEPERELVAV